MIVALLLSFCFLLVAMTVHEFAHGWVAYKLGDPTAKHAGRLTLNPLVHLDLFWTILLPLILFVSTRGQFVVGQAKPVPVSYWALRNPKKDIIWVGASGPLANLFFAGLLSILWRLLPVTETGNFIFEGLITINVILGVFNLIPIPPLDGSRIVMGLLPRQLSFAYGKLEPFGFMIVIILVSLGTFDTILYLLARPMLGWLVVHQ